MEIRALLTERQKVDKFFTIEAVETGNTKGRWETPAQTPFNFINLGATILIPKNTAFDQVKPWGRDTGRWNGR